MILGLDLNETSLVSLLNDKNLSIRNEHYQNKYGTHIYYSTSKSTLQAYTARPNSKVDMFL